MKPKKRNLTQPVPAENLRDTYLILPFQGIWTWLTGKELEGRQPLWHSHSLEMVCWSLAWVLVGCLMTSLAWFGDMSLPLRLGLYLTGVLFAASGARYVVATIIHHGVHGHLFKSQRANKILCEILSTIFIVQPYESYRQFHVYEHHGSAFSTFEDRDLAAIYQLGFKPGKTVRQLYLNLLLTLFSPVFHLKFLLGRMKSNLIDLPLWRQAMSLCWWGVLVCLAVKLGAAFFLLNVLIPFVVVYQMASLLHLLTEHTWCLRQQGESVRDSHIKNCLGRFCGSACPPELSLRCSAEWVRWALIHLFFHLPCRMLIVQGSLVCHDWHHRFGSVRQWYDYARLREKHRLKLEAEGKNDYIDIWGIQHALRYVFNQLSAMDAVKTENLAYRLN